VAQPVFALRGSCLRAGALKVRSLIG
jgi:hypothetical protein